MFIKKVFIAAMTFFNLNLLSVNSLECVLMNNQGCKARPKMIDTNANEPVFEIIIISMIHMLNCAFLTLLKNKRQSI